MVCFEFNMANQRAIVQRATPPLEIPYCSRATSLSVNPFFLIFDFIQLILPHSRLLMAKHTIISRLDLED